MSKPAGHSIGCLTIHCSRIAFACMALAAAAALCACAANASARAAQAVRDGPANTLGGLLPEMRGSSMPGSLPSWANEALLELCEAEAAYRDKQELWLETQEDLVSRWEMLRQAGKAGDKALAHDLREQVAQARLLLDQATSAMEEAARKRDAARAAFDRAAIFNPAV